MYLSNRHAVSDSKDKIHLSAIVYAVYCALLPLNMILNFTGTTVNKYIGLLAAGFFLVDVIRRRNFKLGLHYVVYILFLCWSFCTLLWSVDTPGSTAAFITLLSLVMLTVTALVRGFSAKEIKLIKYFMILSAAPIFFYLAPDLALSYSRGTLQSAAGTADPNGLAANLVFSLLMSVDELKNGKKKLVKILNAICTFLISLSLLLISSRGGLFAAVIAVAVYFVLEAREKKKSLFRYIRWKSVVAVVVVAAAAVWVSKNISLPALRRVSVSEMVSDQGTGRLEIWKAFWTAIWNSPIRFVFGYGYGTEAEISSRYLGYVMGAHNVYLEHWATTGLIGLIVLLVMFIKPLHFAKRHRDNLAFSLVIALMVVCIPLGFLTNKGAWNIFMLAFVGLQNKASDGEGLQ